MKRLKILSSMILIFIVITISVIPVFALDVINGQLFPVVTDVDIANVVIDNNPNIIVYQLHSNPDEYRLFMSTAPIYISGTAPNYYIRSYKNGVVYNAVVYKFNKTTDTQWKRHAVYSNYTNVCYSSSITSPTSNPIYNYDDSSLSIVKFLNFNLLNQDQTIGYMTTLNSTYNYDGYPIGGLANGQLYPDINEFYNSDLFDGIDQIKYPYQIVYNDVSDGSMRLLISNKELKLQLNDQNTYLDILAEKYTNYQRFRLNVDHWEYEIGDNSTDQIYTLVGSMINTTQIYYSNYDIYDPTGIDIIFDDSGNTQGQDGFVDPNPGSDEAVTWYEKLIEKLESLLSLDKVLAYLFVPKFESSQSIISSMKDDIADKLGYTNFTNMLEDVKNLQKTSINDNMTGSFYGVGTVSAKFIDTSYYDNYKPQINVFLYAVMGIGLLIYNINQYFKLLNRGGTLSDGMTVISNQGKGKGGNK